MIHSEYHIVVLGAGESGVGAALLCQQKGLSVFVSDYGQIAPNTLQSSSLQHKK